MSEEKAEPDYSWITDNMFDNELTRIIQGSSAGYILSIPGVYEAVREELNNDVLKRFGKRKPKS